MRLVAWEDGVQMVEGVAGNGLTMAVGKKQVVVMEMVEMKAEEGEVAMSMA